MQPENESLGRRPPKRQKRGEGGTGYKQTGHTNIERETMSIKTPGKKSGDVRKGTVVVFHVIVFAARRSRAVVQHGAQAKHSGVMTDSARLESASTSWRCAIGMAAYACDARARVKRRACSARAIRKA